MAEDIQERCRNKLDDIDKHLADHRLETRTANIHSDEPVDQEHRADLSLI